MKRLLLLGSLLSFASLTGCVPEKEKALTTPSLEENITTDEPETITAIPLTTDEQQQYYAQYNEILQLYNVDNSSTLQPIEQFTANDWVTLEDFETLVEDRLQLMTIVEENTEQHIPTRARRNIAFNSEFLQEVVRVESSFTTQLNNTTEQGRQVFENVESVHSKIQPANLHIQWQQTGYNVQLSEDKTTATVTIGGKLTANGIVTAHVVDMTYTCHPYGSIY